MGSVAGEDRTAVRSTHRRTPVRVPKEWRFDLPTEAKRETVAELREELAKARTMIVSEYRGLKVKEIAEIRRALRKQDVTYRVVKNRLLRIAAEDTLGAALSPLLTGPTAIAFGTDEAATAKAVLDATRPYNKVVRITGAVLGDKAIDAETVSRLAALPSREVLLAQAIGDITGSLSATAGLVDAPLRETAALMQALIDRGGADATGVAATPA
jgi:large subunit ribosomal protein L10